MKIYVVTAGEYSGYGIDSVFLDKHKAEIYCASRNKDIGYGYGDYRIEEYESADDKSYGEVEIAYRYVIHEDDKNAYGHIVPYTPRSLNEVSERTFGYKLKAVVYLRKDSRSKALKIARDMFAQYRAEKEGL